MKKLLFFLMLAFVASSCERVTLDTKEAETLQTHDESEFSRDGDSTTDQDTGFEAVDPKDIVPPRR